MEVAKEVVSMYVCVPDACVRSYVCVCACVYISYFVYLAGEGRKRGLGKAEEREAAAIVPSI